MLISISGDVEVLAPLDPDKRPLLKALDDARSVEHDRRCTMRSSGSLDLLEGETGRRAIVVLSDGEDRYSTASAADVLDRARRSDVLIYPIAIGRERPAAVCRAGDDQRRPLVSADRSARLQATLQAIAEDLRAQYLLGYAPPPRACGGRRAGAVSRYE